MRFCNISSLIIILFLSLTILVSAESYQIDSPEIINALEKAQDNSIEIQKVIDHYKIDSDSLKYQTALYLIANMEEHCYVTYRLFDTLGQDVEMDVLSFPNYDSLLKKVAVIEKERGEIDYEKTSKVYDLETIKADFLIDQIDLAFKVWREKPWAKIYSYEIFKKYILPYRGSNEPLEKWRVEFIDKYAHLESQMKNTEDPIEVASLINDDIKEWFHFDERFYFHPTDQGLSEMMDTKLGRCEDMTNLTIYALRANGLPITSDYTPHWANTGNNHAWNAIVKSDGEVVPFMGAEANPGTYKLFHKAAKVYRKSYAQNKSNLIFRERKQEKIPRWLAGKSYLDVTTDYVDVAEFTIAFEKEIPDSVDIAYVCVFNSGGWRAIDWAPIENGTATFKNVGTGIAYITALYLNEEIEPYSPPFILGDDKSITYLAPNTETEIKVNLVSTTKRKKIESTEGIEKIFLKPGVTYELLYFDFEWKSLGKAEAGDKPLQFEKIPSNSLLWLTAEDSSRDERIFTIDTEGKQIWW